MFTIRSPVAASHWRMDYVCGGFFVFRTEFTMLAAVKPTTTATIQ